MEPTIIAIISIGFFASFIRSSFGFGESLVAVPLLALFIPLETAVPLSVMLSVVIALMIVIQDHSKIHLSSAKWLILSALPGIPLGLFLLLHGNPIWIKTILGLLIFFYSLYSVTRKINHRLKQDHKGWLLTCGLLSGILGGAYGLNGPPLVVYGHLRRWSAAHFRATLQAYFLPVSLLGLAAYYQQGLLTSTTNRYFFYCLPAVIPAVFLGRFVNKRLPAVSFLKYVFYLLMVISLILIFVSEK